MITYTDLLKEGIEFLKLKGVPFAERDARFLLIHAMGSSSAAAFAFTYQNQQATALEIEAYKRHLIRRGNREPLSYIEGAISFYGAHIKVSSAVLIPRQETEIFTEKFCTSIQQSSFSEPVVWDVCCGSGCIGIAVKKKLPNARVVLSDICPKALSLARENAKINDVQVEILQGDFLDPFQGSCCDFLICNPPYVTEKEWQNLDPEVRDYEPKKALVGPGCDGLGLYRQLANTFHHYLRRDGELWLELGFEQGNLVKKIFLEKGYSGEVFQDWSGQDRFFFLEYDKKLV